MHKLWTLLNARLKQWTPWRPQEGQNQKIHEAPLATQTVTPLVPRFGYRRRLKRGVGPLRSMQRYAITFVDQV